MKTLFLTTAIALMLSSTLCSCSSEKANAAGHQPHTTLNPAPKTTKDLGLKDFNAINNSSALTVVYTQGKSFSVKLEERAALHSTVTLKGKTLTVKCPESNNNDDRVNTWLYITAPELLNISNSGVFNIKGENTSGNSLGVDNTGVCNLEIKKVDNGSLNIKNTGVITLNTAVNTGEATINNTGVMNADASIKGKKLNISNSGMGNMKFAYTGGDLMLYASGAGRIALDLDCSKVKASNFGTCSITLKGKAADIDTEANGLSDIDVSQLQKR